MAFADENLWKIKLGKTTVGFICCYVDDMMIIGEQSIVEVMAGHIKKEWDATDLVLRGETRRRWGNPGGAGGLHQGCDQPVRERGEGEAHPVPKEIEKDGEDEEQDMEMVRRAGELLWATQTRPDISYGVNRISQLIARAKKRSRKTDLGGRAKSEFRPRWKAGL